MASAITCNFPTWCSSFHRRDWEQWKIVSLAPRLSVHVKCTNSFTFTGWHIWKCSLPSSSNVCGDSVSVCEKKPPSHCNWKPFPQCPHSDTEPLLYTSDPYINTSFQASLGETTPRPPDICFHIADFYPIFPSTPTNFTFLRPCKKLQEINSVPKLCGCVLITVRARVMFPLRTEGEVLTLKC